MTTYLSLLIMCTVFFLLLLVCLPWVMQPSAEAKRMFSLVKSNREDKRRVRPLERFTNQILRRTEKLRSKMRTGANAKVRRRFAEAGLRAPFMADLFIWVQSMGAMGGAICGSFVSSSPYFWTTVGGLVGFMAPDVWLGARQRRRQERIRRGVPDMVDLLVICVGAGLGIDQALVRVTAEVRLSHPDLSDELERVLRERGVGASRVDAWRALAERVHLEEIAAFVTMLAESDRFGSPIVTSLIQFSDELRTKRRQHAEEAAAKTKVKIIFPLVLCIFPCIFVVLLVPAVLGFFHSFSTIGR